MKIFLHVPPALVVPAPPPSTALHLNPISFAADFWGWGGCTRGERAVRITDAAPFLGRIASTCSPVKIASGHQLCGPRADAGGAGRWLDGQRGWQLRQGPSELPLRGEKPAARFLFLGTESPGPRPRALCVTVDIGRWSVPSTNWACGFREERGCHVTCSVQHKAPSTAGPVHRRQQRKCPEA